MVVGASWPTSSDEFSRETLAVRVDQTCIADQLVEVIEALVATRGAPNSCGRTMARDDRLGVEGVVPAVGNPQHLHRTGLAPGEPFRRVVHGRLRDQLLNVEEFADLRQAQVIVEYWRIEYNTYRPHSAPDGLTPDQYAKAWINQRPTLPK
jgi:transposase InsO family protein